MIEAASDRSEQLVLELDGYEGPIDLLLALARDQKVDLGKISILALADQYLAFIGKQRSLNLEIAADYLVMAAWLAYLKSRLLLPQAPQDDEPSGAELASQLEHSLRLLEAMQAAGARLMVGDHGERLDCRPRQLADDRALDPQFGRKVGRRPKSPSPGQPHQVHTAAGIALCELTQQAVDIGLFIEMPQEGVLADRLGDREQKRFDEPQLLRAVAHPSLASCAAVGAGLRR